MASTSGFITTEVPLSFKKNSGGLNSSGSPLDLAENESPDLQNVDFDKFGSILKRNGYTRLNTDAFNSGAAWNSLYYFVQKAGGSSFLIGTCGDKLAKMDDLDGTWDDITGSLTITAGNDVCVSYATFLDTVLGTNNVNVPFKWAGSGNGAALTVPTGLTKARFVIIFQNYTLLASCTVSGTAYKSRFYWSTINTIETWDAADYIDVSQNDGQELTGARVLGEKLILFKDSSIHYATFTGDRDIPFIVNKSASSVGCIAPESIQEVENGLVFLSYDGFYYFDGNNSYKISDRITKTLDTFAPTRFQYSKSCYQKRKNKYWASFTTSGGTTHNRAITWDSFNNSFGYYNGHNISSITSLVYNGDERVYFGDYSGYVYRADFGATDNPAGTATAINAYFNTRWHHFDDICDVKGVPHIYLYYQISNTTLTFAYGYDFENADTYSQTFSLNTGTSVYGTAVYDSGTYAGTGGRVIRRDLNGQGRVIRLKFANAVSGETFQIDGYGASANLQSKV